MLKFYHLPSSCSVAVKTALTLTQESHETMIVDTANKSADFLKANPLGKVPAIVDGDHTVSEGGAINLWLSARNKEARLMPDLASAEGAQALKWLFFVYATLHPVWVRMFYPSRFGGEGDGEKVAYALAEKELFSHYQLIAKQLSDHDFIAGDFMSLADLYLASTIHWESKVDNRLTKKFPILAAHRARVRNVPGVKEAFVGEFGYTE